MKITSCAMFAIRCVESCKKKLLVQYFAIRCVQSCKAECKGRVSVTVRDRAPELREGEKRTRTRSQWTLDRSVCSWESILEHSKVIAWKYLIKSYPRTEGRLKDKDKDALVRVNLLYFHEKVSSVIIVKPWESICRESICMRTTEWGSNLNYFTYSTHYVQMLKPQIWWLLRCKTVSWCCFQFHDQDPTAAHVACTVLFLSPVDVDGPSVLGQSSDYLSQGNNTCSHYNLQIVSLSGMAMHPCFKSARKI